MSAYDVWQVFGWRGLVVCALLAAVLYGLLAWCRRRGA